MSWTDERIDELTRLWQAGHSASDIGKRLGVSKNAVVGKAHRLKLPSRPSPIKQGENGEEVQANGHAAAQNGQQGGTRGGQAAANGSGQQRKRSGNGARKGSGSGNGKEQWKAAANKVVSQRAQLEQRGQRTGCLWPFGDPSEPDFHFCGAQSLPGKPYCQEHAQRAYITRSRDRDGQDERDEEAA
ncbi:GcrA cell cycle regulator [Limimonas halophila]|uniref:GcrA cell cycle regulator n=1 Tax=Limimonas halophila TaxID=1082479 RepID=A0A1G7PRZ6_9PROT|nr:GcrA family cell cycle regulator [Limimonas halophila]SDF88190.1 GcrA cell cycle regulator [Limimonas halophila]